MTQIIISPGKYIQGSGELDRIKDHVEHLGKSFFIIISKSGYGRFGDSIKKSFGEDTDLHFVEFNGECSKGEIDRLRDELKGKRGDVVIGIGGGKIHDASKAVAYYEKTPVVIVPTIASTDAPCSALSVLYTDDGAFDEYLILPKNPDVVLIDIDAVATAPVRLLVAGMGDALANLCYDTLLKEGLKAKLAVENKVVTKAVEKIVEANTLLSGIGFESGGLGAAHAIHNGLTLIEEAHDLYHGEKVAFGVLVQLVLENAPIEEIHEVIGFCEDIGLPTTLEDLNAKDVSADKLMEVAKLSCAEGETIHNMPFVVTEKDVYAAILTADALGREFKSR